MVCLGTKWHLSETHMKIFLGELCKEDKNDMNMSYGDWMFDNDERRAEHTCCQVYTWIKDTEKCMDFEDSHNNGSLCMQVPGFRNMIEGFAKLQGTDDIEFPKIPEELQAMYNIMQPLTKHGRPVDRKANIETFKKGDKTRLDEEAAKDAPSWFNMHFEKCPEMIKELFNGFPKFHDKARMNFTEMIIQQRACIGYVQDAKRAEDLVKYMENATESSEDVKTKDDSAYKFFEEKKRRFPSLRTSVRTRI